MDRINIQASSDYDVLIGTGLIDTCGTHIRECLIRAQKALIVTDSNVAPLYLGRVRSSLEREGFSVSEYVFEAGEEKKNIDSIAGMWAVMAEEEFTRTDIVVSLGGGVATDMGGFAAATFLRGIKVVQIPTSLLAMADAALGGKTGIDLPQGKNLAGAFHQPSMVIEDTDIMDKDLYDVLSKIASEGRAMSLQEDIDTLTKILISCVKDKAEVITEDEKDNGRRQILNYGHTIGHVIERNSNFTLAHGVCVAKGMGINLYEIQKTTGPGVAVTIIEDVKAGNITIGFPGKDGNTRIVTKPGDKNITVVTTDETRITQQVPEA